MGVYDYIPLYTYADYDEDYKFETYEKEKVFKKFRK